MIWKYIIIFHRWASMGADGWSYSEVLPYFIKSEANDDPQLIKSGSSVITISFQWDLT